MKEFIEKLIGRLEEKFKYNSEQAEIYRDGSDKDAYFREKKDLYMDRANTYGEVMRIVNRLAEEYKDAEEQGLLLRLPCKVGSTLYQPISNRINEYKVIGLCFDITRNEWMYECAYQIGLEWYKTTCDFDNINKTVFLTKEEAEQALKQIGE